MVFSQTGLEGGQDPLISHDEQAREHERQRGQPHETTPAAGDVIGGGVLDRGVGTLGGAATSIGEAMGLARIVVLLPGLGIDDAIGSAWSRDFDPPSSSQGEGS